MCRWEREIPRLLMRSLEEAKHYQTHSHPQSLASNDPLKPAMISVKRLLLKMHSLLLLLHLLDIELELLALEDVAVSAARLAGSGDDASEKSASD